MHFGKGKPSNEMGGSSNEICHLSHKNDNEGGWSIYSSVPSHALICELLLALPTLPPISNITLRVNLSVEFLLLHFGVD
uniref:Uncharacterized protein n=1 Tax=Rhizophora mucronata TaxID=61149 RepID=A0A2P2N1K8_RHIMU